ncbi:putative pentatricopeptide repeat-containing protein At1g56570 [Pistacia vera]|uniref:putative pentatricopeptide repeat-containing protein At1g56570 n=1 Tax=Pistacia vera TaxID=55513 RepID=UPI001262AFDB|nr:putative pentatricopeptide repeat-containing protein At1g56570 [Pistacia vera]
MSAKKLLSSAATSTFHFNKLPPIVTNSLTWPHKPYTQPKPPTTQKGPSILATNLIRSYFEKGLIKEARTLFDEMPDRDVVTWTAMIACYTSSNYHTHAWNMLVEMVRSEVEPNAFTVSSVLKACKAMKCVLHGALVHGLAIKKGLEGSIYVDNALMDMYATCCVFMDDACIVFKVMKIKNDVSWTTLITGYTHRGDGYAGLRVFRQMLMEEVELSPYSFSIAVRACTSTGRLIFGKLIHAAVTKHGFGSNLPVMNSMLDMYCRCGGLSEANQYFHEMTEKDLITWNTLIAGYERTDSLESLNIFSQMESEGFCPNCFTFTSIIAACANLAVLRCGQQVHGGIVRRGIDGNLALANALIDMYAKCGNISDSQKIFREMSRRDLVTWTSMMIGYGAHGYGKEAVELFDEMVTSGVRPDRIVFMAVLSACSHAGLVDEGLRYFSSMMGDYNIKPDKETYGCVVDLLGRAGRVREAYELIERMPLKPDESIWGTLLSACKAHRFPNLGKLAAQRVLDLRPNMMGTYVTLSNIYADEGKWGDFAKVRKLMKLMGNKKEAGRSWIEVKNQVYSFFVSDKMGSHTESVYEILELMIRHMSETENVPDIDCLIHDLNGGN